METMYVIEASYFGNTKTFWNEAKTLMTDAVIMLQKMREEWVDTFPGVELNIRQYTADEISRRTLVGPNTSAGQ